MPPEALLRRVWRSLKRRGLDFELAYRCADEGTQEGGSALDGYPPGNGVPVTTHRRGRRQIIPFWGGGGFC